MLPPIDGDVVYVLLAGCLYTVMTLAMGLPLAAMLHRDQVGWAKLAYDGLVLGLMATLLLGLGLARIDQFDPAPILAGIVVVSAVGAWAARRSGVRLPAMSPPTSYELTVGLVAAVGMALRLSPINFVFQTGDMGAYVNAANQLGAAGDLRGGFPHLFTVFLAIPSDLLGARATVGAVPWLGLLLILGVLRLGADLGAPRWGSVALAGAVAVANQPVWFSVFPVSETLNALLVLFGLIMVARLATRPTPALIAVAAALGLCLGLLRGNALLLLPLGLVAAVPAGAYRSADAPAGGGMGADTRVRVWSVAALVSGVGAAALYNMEFLPHYYVGLQLRSFIPGAIFDLLQDLGLLELSLKAVVAVAVGTVAIAGVGWLSFLATARRRWPRWLGGAIPVAVVAVCALATVGFGPEELVEGLSRVGLLFLAMGGAGLVLALRSERVSDAAVGGSAAAVFGTFAALHAYRFPEVRIHHYFQYWDRYLFSEMFPALLALALVGMAVAGRLLPAERTLRTVGGAGAAAALVLCLPLVTKTELALDNRMFGDPYGTVSDLDDLTSDPELPVLWSTSDASVPAGWFFPNTFRAYGTPLAETFGRTVLNLPANNFAADPVLTADSVVKLMTKAGVAEAYVIETYDGGDAFDVRSRSDALEVSPAAEIRAIVPILPQTADPRWRHESITFRVYRVAAR